MYWFRLPRWKCKCFLSCSFYTEKYFSSTVFKLKKLLTHPLRRDIYGPEFELEDPLFRVLGIKEAMPLSVFYYCICTCLCRWRCFNPSLSRLQPFNLHCCFNRDVLRVSSRVPSLRDESTWTSAWVASLRSSSRKFPPLPLLPLFLLLFHLSPRAMALAFAQ